MRYRLLFEIIEKFLKPDDSGNFLRKIESYADRKSYFMNGNKISTAIYNYGGIGPGFGLIRGVNNFVWRERYFEERKEVELSNYFSDCYNVF